MAKIKCSASQHNSNFHKQAKLRLKLQWHSYKAKQQVLWGHLKSNSIHCGKISSSSICMCVSKILRLFGSQGKRIHMEYRTGEGIMRAMYGKWVIGTNNIGKCKVTGGTKNSVRARRNMKNCAWILQDSELHQPILYSLYSQTSECIDKEWHALS
jgi:hypothetical protein